MLVEKESAKTREGKPYLWVTFCDAKRRVKFPVWSDTALHKELKGLKPGAYCKLRATYQVTSSHGPQLAIHKIREVSQADTQDGFDIAQIRPASPLLADTMFTDLYNLAEQQLGTGKLHLIVTKILKDHRRALSSAVASRQHHHNYIGGLLEHTLSVAKIAVSLVDHYHGMYPGSKKEISRLLVAAGAILHDIGKVREYELHPGSMQHSTEGELIGHAILGRDVVREAAKEFELESSVLMRLEHIIISHQRFPDWGAAKPPMSLEAMIVHHADSCDALLGCFWNIFSHDLTEQTVTGKKNVLGYPLLKPSEPPQ